MFFYHSTARNLSIYSRCFCLLSFMECRLIDWLMDRWKIDHCFTLADKRNPSSYHPCSDWRDNAIQLNISTEIWEMTIELISLLDRDRRPLSLSTPRPLLFPPHSLSPFIQGQSSPSLSPSSPPFLLSLPSLSLPFDWWTASQRRESLTDSCSGSG